jgi:uncharacterized damage-inducible protein DinB
MERQFLDHSINTLKLFATRIETCLGMLNEEQIWARGNENENAIGNLVLHLCGNVRQWIISNIGGQPDFRQRDSEFSARGGASTADLLERLRGTVAEAVGVIDGVTAQRLLDRRVIQGEDVSVLQAIYHVVEHFTLHAGQIIFATKMLTGTDLGFYRHLSTAAGQGQKK